jgi:hypothetical protein
MFFIFILPPSRARHQTREGRSLLAAPFAVNSGDAGYALE